MVDLCPRASSLRRCLLKRHLKSWEVLPEHMQIVIYIGGISKMVDHVLGLCFMERMYGFLFQRLTCAGGAGSGLYVMSGVLSRFDSFNGNGLAFGEPPWRFVKLHIIDATTLSLGEEVIHHFFAWWLLCW